MTMTYMHVMYIMCNAKDCHYHAFETVQRVLITTKYKKFLEYDDIFTIFTRINLYKMTHVGIDFNPATFEMHVWSYTTLERHLKLC